MTLLLTADATGVPLRAENGVAAQPDKLCLDYQKDESIKTERNYSTN
jgi:hypothetical protein